MNQTEKTEPTTETDPSALPFGAPFAAWVKANIKAEDIAANGDPDMALRRVIWKHVRRREDAGLGTDLEDAITGAVSRLADCASGWRNQAERLRAAIERVKPLAWGTLGDPREFHEAVGAMRAGAEAVGGLVNAYVATAEKLAVIGDAERMRAAQRRTERIESRRAALATMSLEALKAVAVRVGGIASPLDAACVGSTRKAPLITAIIAHEFGA